MDNDASDTYGRHSNSDFDSESGSDSYSDFDCDSCSESESDSYSEGTIHWRFEPGKFVKKFFALPLSEREQEASKWLARVALTYYNKKHGQKYELVEIVYNTYTSIWNHINFKAKAISISGSSSPDPVPELFFAEVFGGVVSHYCNCCYIISNPNDDLLQRGCAICDPKCLHPHESWYRLKDDDWDCFGLSDSEQEFWATE